MYTERMSWRFSDRVLMMRGGGCTNENLVDLRGSFAHHQVSSNRYLGEITDLGWQNTPGLSFESISGM